MSRRDSRERALQVLFSLDFSNPPNLKKDMIDLSIPEEDLFCWELVDGFMSQKDTIDKIIQSKLKKWKIDRLHGVDRNCLRLGVYEMNYLKQDKGVVINEYIEIAKKYAETDSGAFVNGVLDAIES